MSAVPVTVNFVASNINDAKRLVQLTKRKYPSSKFRVTKTPAGIAVDDLDIYQPPAKKTAAVIHNLPTIIPDKTRPTVIVKNPTYKQPDLTDTLTESPPPPTPTYMNYLQTDSPDTLHVLEKLNTRLPDHVLEEWWTDSGDAILAKLLK